MAIFGSFSDIPIPDVISLIGNSTGTLTISRYESQHVFLFGIQNSIITTVRFNGQEIQDEDQARSFITELIQTNEGEFEFERGDVQSGFHTLPISGVLNSSLTLIDEIQAYREHFPDPHTVFIATENNKGWLNPELNDFWLTSYHHFQKGVSALDIQNQMGLYVDQVLLKFYKLRTGGLIAPKRAFTHPAAERVDDLSKIPKRTEIERISTLLQTKADDDIHSVVDQLAEQLQPIWQNGTTPHAVGEPIPEKPPAPPEKIPEEKTPELAEANLKDVQLAQPSKPMVNHLLKSIWNIISSKK